MFVAVPDCLKDSVRDVSPSHWRLQAVTVTCNNCTILIVSSYFPNDPKTVQIDQGPLQEVFQSIQETIDKNDFDYFCLAGDINTNWLRINSGHVKAVDQFINELDLVKSWELFNVDFTHSHVIDDVTHVSIIDYFLWNQGLTPFIEECGVLHLVENNSDHEPAYLLHHKCSHC